MLVYEVFGLLYGGKLRRVIRNIFWDAVHVPQQHKHHDKVQAVEPEVSQLVVHTCGFGVSIQDELPVAHHRVEEFEKVHFAPLVKGAFSLARMAIAYKLLTKLTATTADGIPGCGEVGAVDWSDNAVSSVAQYISMYCPAVRSIEKFQ